MILTEAIDMLKVNGYKYTDKRGELLRLFAESDKYLTARDVQQAIEEKFPSLSYDTIYRNLSVFAELGILEYTELSGEKRFRFACDVNHHHHHFICTECGVSKDISLCPMKEVSGRLSGYQISGHKFEIYGKCPNCVAQFG